MNIQVLSLLSIQVFLAYSLTLNLASLCKCSELVYEQDCNNADGVCTWNKNSCENVACSNIQSQVDCTYVPKRCYWSSGQCKDFTSCSQIQGNTTAQCKNSNFYCPASNGTNCGPIDQLQTCSAQTSLSACNSYYSQQGLCVWNGGQCVVASSCAQFYNATSHSCQYIGCYISGTTCLPKTCSYYKNQYLCQIGVEIFGPYLQNVVACQWNQAQNVCEDFAQSSIDSDECFLYSLGTYSWSESKSSKGSCQQCFGGIIQILVIITISLLS